MLELIASYAVQKGLTVRPGFTTKTIKWRIDFNADGEFIGVQELGSSGEKKNPGLQYASCPEFPANEMQSGGKAHPLVESLNVVALLAKSATEPITSKDEGKHSFYVDLLKDMGSVITDAELAAAALQNAEILTAIQADLLQQKAKSTDKATIAVDGNLLLEDDLMLEWWAAKRVGDQADPEASALCLITGQPTSPLASHPKISGLGAVGGLGIGSSLISFDKGAFTSYGLEQSANASVSEDATMQYRAGLNHLIANGKKLGPMIVGYWYSHDLPLKEDPAHFLQTGELDEDEEETNRADARLQMQKLLGAIETGERADLRNYTYYSVAVSGAAGRVMLRGWEQLRYVDVLGNVNRWFCHMEITTSDGLNVVSPPKLIAVAATTVRELDELQAPSMAAIWKCALTGSRVPLAAIQGALKRTRIDILEDQIRPIRMGLLKAFLIRNTHFGAFMKPTLNTEHPSVAYQAGRLMAMLANIQFAALGDVNANVVQRFYPAACSTPALVFGRLIRQAQFHLNKIDSGLAWHLEEKLAGTWAMVQSDLPTTFTLEQQTLFAMGYYQQLAQDSRDRSDNKTKKAADLAAKKDKETI